VTLDFIFEVVDALAQEALVGTYPLADLFGVGHVGSLQVVDDRIVSVETPGQPQEEDQHSYADNEGKQCERNCADCEDD